VCCIGLVVGRPSDFHFFDFDSSGDLLFGDSAVARVSFSLDFAVSSAAKRDEAPEQKGRGKPQAGHRSHVPRSSHESLLDRNSNPRNEQ